MNQKNSLFERFTLELIQLPSGYLSLLSGPGGTGPAIVLVPDNCSLILDLSWFWSGSYKTFLPSSMCVLSGRYNQEEKHENLANLATERSKEKSNQSDNTEERAKIYYYWNWWVWWRMKQFVERWERIACFSIQIILMQ